MSSAKPEKSNDKLLLKYLGYATQLMVSLALSIFIGLKLDKWLKLTPLLVWILPLLVLVVLIWQVIKDTAKK